jgi:hypothetical protein
MEEDGFVGLTAFIKVEANRLNQTSPRDNPDTICAACGTFTVNAIGYTYLARPLVISGIIKERINIPHS